MKLPTTKQFAKTPSEGHKNRHVLGNEGVWAFIFGVIAFVFAQIFPRLENLNFSTIVLQRDEYIFTWPVIVGLSAWLLLFVVTKYFCTKDDEGLLEMSNKHRWVRPFGFVIGGIFFFCLGWLFAFGIVLWMSTLRT